MAKADFLHGSVFHGLLNFMVPVLGALLLQAAYGAADVFVIGMFCDAASLSGVGTGSVAMNIVIFGLVSLAMGSTVVIGQHIGEGAHGKAEEAAGATLVLFAIISVIGTVLIEIFTPEILHLLRVPAEAFEKTEIYFRICVGGTVVITAYNVISCIMRGLGNSKLPFLFVLIACIVNIVGDFILIGGFGMDVAGAAIATVFSQLVSVVVSVIVLRKVKFGIDFASIRLGFYPEEMKKILKIGIPLMVEELTVEVSFLVMNAIINAMGLIESAGYGVAQKLIAFVMLIPSALMQSVSAFVAQNFGAQNYARIKEGYRKSIFAGTVFCTGVFLISYFGGGLMSRAFTSDPAVIKASHLYIQGFSFDCILTCYLFASIGLLNGTGHTFPVFMQGVTSAIIVRIPSALLLSSIAGATLFHVGLAAPITTVYGIVFFWVTIVIMKRRKTEKALL